MSGVAIGDPARSKGDSREIGKAFDPPPPPLFFRPIPRRWTTDDRSRGKLVCRRRLDTNEKCRVRFFVLGRVVAFGQTMWRR